MTTTWGKAEREIENAADAETETTPSDHSAIDASSLASSSIALARLERDETLVFKNSNYWFNKSIN